MQRVVGTFGHRIVTCKTPSAQPVEAQVDHDAFQPRTDAALPRLPPRRIAPQPQQRFLRQILRLGRIAYRMIGDAVQWAYVRVDKRTKRDRITRAHPCHQRIVADRIIASR
jgi:hypothetical protein